MFDDEGEYQHEFSRSSSLIFPLHGTSSSPAAAAAYHHHHHPYTSSSHDQILQPTKKVEEDNLAVESERSLWSDNELLALLKIRSSVDNWFPDLIWEHVSRKLGDLGFKRSAERCKQKFEEETRSFNTSFNRKSDARFFSLEEFIHNDDYPSNLQDQETNAASEKVMKTSSQDDLDIMSDSQRMVRKKRKRSKLETLRCFCINMVNKMMGQQEELHNKLLQEMIVRDEQKIATREALKMKEMERLNKEMEIRARQQAFEGDRQAVLIDFLNKFTLGNQLCLSQFEDLFKLQNRDEVASCVSETAEPKTPASVALNALTLKYQTNSGPKVERKSYKGAKDVEDMGKRWPKDEVLALINIRSSFGNGSHINEDQEKEKGVGSKGGSLWEKISKGMSELGYERSAKRCKEKWENINKYFRKTKDSKKKRSIDSRTCPYFHHLTTLYNIPSTTTLENKDAGVAGDLD